MDIHFTVSDIRDPGDGDGRISAFPQGSAVKLVRLRPDVDEHKAAVGDVVVAVLAEDAADLTAEEIDRAPLVAGDGRTAVGKVTTPGTKAVLSIG